MISRQRCTAARSRAGDLQQRRRGAPRDRDGVDGVQAVPGLGDQASLEPVVDADEHRLDPRLAGEFGGDGQRREDVAGGATAGDEDGPAHGVAFVCG
jgi:hypothetical protein